MKDWNQCSDEIGRKLGWLPLNSPSTQVPLSFAEKVAELYAKEVAIEAVKLARYQMGDISGSLEPNPYTKQEILNKLKL